MADYESDGRYGDLSVLGCDRTADISQRRLTEGETASLFTEERRNSNNSVGVQIR